MAGIERLHSKCEAEPMSAQLEEGGNAPGSR